MLFPYNANSSALKHFTNKKVSTLKIAKHIIILSYLY